MSLLLVLEVARFIPLMLILAVAAYQDLTKTVTAVDENTGETFTCGSVSNKLWRYAPFGLALTVLELFYLSPLILLSVVSIVVSVIVACIFFVFHGWGGADAKAFMLIGVSAPLMPLWGSLFPLPLPFVVLFVSCACAVAYGLLKRSSVPFMRRKVRFLPFMFVGLLVSIFI